MNRKMCENALKLTASPAKPKGLSLSLLLALLAALSACATVPPLPRNTVLDTENHLLASSNFHSSETGRILLVVTGMPEGPNKIADSTRSYLDDFFALQDAETACAQIYAPALFGDWGAYRKYLEHALIITRAPVDLVVYSAGALSLPGLNRDLWGRIRSLTLASPFAGRQSMAVHNGMGPGKRFFARILVSRVPPTEQFLHSLDDLIETLLLKGIPVAVSLGIRDELLDNTVISNGFARYNLHKIRVPIQIVDRAHGLTADGLKELFNAAGTR